MIGLVVAGSGAIWLGRQQFVSAGVDQSESALKANCSIGSPALTALFFLRQLTLDFSPAHAARLPLPTELFDDSPDGLHGIP